MKKLKVGIFGFGVRGQSLYKDFMLLGCDIVAVCETRKNRLDYAAQLIPDAAMYDDFDKFIEHDMDIVMLMNFFPEHAPYAIRCFEKNIHVYSECISNGTMAEGVDLIRAYKNTKSIYFFAENYPNMIFNREMKRVCDTGTLGKILYAEGEYNHPVGPTDVQFQKDYMYTLDHWRHFLPRAYYLTHSLGPIMSATGATPKKVTALATFAQPAADDIPNARFCGDRAVIMMTQNDDGSVFKFTGCAGFGAHGNSYRICGTEGQIENHRGTENVALRYNSWSIPDGLKEVNIYKPDWNDKDEELIKTSGHGGADFITIRAFLECIRENKQPELPFDIYSAINMSSVAILAHRSMLEGGKPYDIPDFTKEEDCKKYENDRLSPFPSIDGSAPTLPCCSVTDYAPTENQLRLFKEQVMGIKE